MKLYNAMEESYLKENLIHKWVTNIVRQNDGYEFLLDDEVYLPVYKYALKITKRKTVKLNLVEEKVLQIVSIGVHQVDEIAKILGITRKFDFSFSDEKGRQLLLMYVVPILVGLKIVDISLYNQFVCGKSSKPLMDIYKDSDKGEWLATRLLNRNEAFEVEEGKSVVTVEQKIQQLYDAIFVTEYTGNVYHTILGEYEFDDNSKNFVKSVESMLSVYADYNI